MNAKDIILIGGASHTGKTVPAQRLPKNGQKLIAEGCYIPFDWTGDFEKEYLERIEYRCPVMSEGYIQKHFDDIKKYANIIEKRLDDSCCTPESLIADNKRVPALAKAHNVHCVLIDTETEYEKLLCSLI